ncbi:MAG: 16S rRNA pseudouridine(516) synthase [Epulopiscium sp. Nuni2H_MBin003]|nr:MAG: 16S rRNA pseudouridine(516) synthase [Epulopiscium sp. Nuni2H_MBin003]
MRLDRYLSHVGCGTRTEVQKLVKQKRVSVDNVIVTTPNMHINNQVVKLDNYEVIYKEYYYFILNKPQGVITATEDSQHKTVLDLLNIADQNKKVAPIGRLDKDTEGLLILTNDGKLSHNLTSPAKHVNKIYYAKIQGNLDKDAVEKFSLGIQLNDGTKYKSAKLEVISNDEIYVTINEGKFHQVKKMVKAVGAEVIFLKRVKMGNLDLPEDLLCGEYRELTEDELDKLR